MPTLNLNLRLNGCRPSGFGPESGAAIALTASFQGNTCVIDPHCRALHLGSRFVMYQEQQIQERFE